MQSLYPSHAWKEWKFPTVPATFWKKPANVLKFLESIRISFGFDQLEDLYSLNSEIVLSEGGSQLWDQCGQSLPKLAKFAYPHHKWHSSQFGKSKQDMLHKTMARL